ncbi:MAG TPA: hypothetical protein VFW71_07455 [Actinomycetota bacterium]|nr:hypothetical protein [Actinomycetota bacterium]
MRPAIALGSREAKPLTAVGAPNGALEMLVVNTLCFSRLVAEVQQVLDGVEQVLVHQRLVATRVLHAIEADIAEVVPVGEHVANSAFPDRVAATLAVRQGAVGDGDGMMGLGDSTGLGDGEGLGGSGRRVGRGEGLGLGAGDPQG